MKKIGLMYYLKKHIKPIMIYVFLVLVATAVWTINTLLFANTISKVTAGEYETALRYLLYIFSLIILMRACWLSTNYLYNKYSGIIMSEISIDLTKRSFELSSSTFSENNSGTFLQRIMDDPARAVDLLAQVLDIFSDIISITVVIIYVITLNWIIGLVYLIAIIGLSVLETFRLKIRKKGKNSS